MNGRKTGARKAGTPNKATAEIRDLARADGPAVFKFGANDLWYERCRGDFGRALVAGLKRRLG